MSTRVVCGLTDEFDEEMVTVLSKPARPFSPDVPGDELGDHLLFTVCRAGESLFQSVCHRVSPEGPGTGVCQPDVERGPLDINIVLNTSKIFFFLTDSSSSFSVLDIFKKFSPTKLRI